MFANVSHFGSSDWIVAYVNREHGLPTFRSRRFFRIPHQVRDRDSAPYTLTGSPKIVEHVRKIPDHPESFDGAAAVRQISIRLHRATIWHPPDTLPSTAPAKLCIAIPSILATVQL